MKPQRIYLQAPNPGTEQHFFSIRKKYCKNSLHWHDYYELELIIKGSGTHCLNGESYPLSRGCAYLLSPKDFHTVTEDSDSPLILYNINFSEQILPPALLEKLTGWNPTPTLTFTEAETQQLEVLMDALIEEYKATRESRTEMITALFSQLLIHILRAAPTQPNGTEASLASSPPINHVISYLKIHFREPVTLAECAKTVYLTPNYLGELFRAQTGTSFRQYLQKLRFEYAVGLLRASNATVEEISRISGFSSPSYFTALFREKYTITPTEYRQSLPPSAT